ncbi:hypothetical protein [Gloeothece verrucosa]|nr:hypothetical protein [Gloeothece verrucosa]
MKPPQNLEKLISHLKHYKKIYPSVYPPGKSLIRFHLKKIEKQIQEYS